MKGPVAKLISIILAINLVFQGVAWSVPIQEPLTINREPLTALHIPEQYGRIGKSQVSRPAAAGTPKSQVILIKDAHCHYEAQRNIEKILDILIKDYKIDFVCVEGARNLVDTSILASYPDKDTRREVINKYVRKGLFTASEALSIKNGLESGFAIYGVEDKNLYWRNFQSFRRTIGNGEYVERFIYLVKNIVDGLKRKVYSDRLREFDNKAGRYRRGEVRLTDWIRFIRNQKPVTRNQKIFDLVAKSIDLEDEIDFGTVERERLALIRELEKTLPKEELRRLIEKGLLFKLGRISSLDYYVYLKQYVNQPNLIKYVRLVELQSKIDEDMLFKELGGIEDTIYEMYIENEIQRNLYQLDKDIYVLEKILHTQATRREIAYYKENKERFVPDNLLNFIKIQARLNGIKLPPELADKEFLIKAQRAISPAEEFYNLAVKRDRAIVDNLLRQMKKENKDKAVLVAGGFHGDGIMELLSENGVNCISIVPVITRTQEDAHELYLRRMLDPAIDPVKMLGEAGLSNLQAPLASPNDLTGPEKERLLEELLREPARDLARDAFKAAQESLKRPEGEKDETDRLREFLYKSAEKAAKRKQASIENEGYRRMLEEEYLAADDELYAQFLLRLLKQYCSEEKMEQLQKIRSERLGAVPMQGALERDIRETAKEIDIDPDFIWELTKILIELCGFKAVEEKFRNNEKECIDEWCALNVFIILEADDYNTDVANIEGLYIGNIKEKEQMLKDLLREETLRKLLRYFGYRVFIELFNKMFSESWLFRKEAIKKLIMDYLKREIAYLLIYKGIEPADEKEVVSLVKEIGGIESCMVESLAKGLGIDFSRLEVGSADVPERKIRFNIRSPEIRNAFLEGLRELLKFSSLQYKNKFLRKLKDKGIITDKEYRDLLLANGGKAAIPWFQKKFGIFGPLFEELVFRWVPLSVMLINPFFGLPLLIALDFVFVKLHLEEDKDISIFVSLINTVFLFSALAVHLFSPLNIWVLIGSVVFITLFVHYFWNRFGNEFHLRGFWLCVRRGMLIAALLIPFILPRQVVERILPLPTEERIEMRGDIPIFTGLPEEGETKLDLRKLNGRMPIERSLENLLYNWYKRKLGRDLTEKEEAKVKRQAEDYRAQGIYNPSPAEIEEVCGEIAGILHSEALPDFSEEEIKIFLEALLEAESDNRHWIIREKDGKPEVYVLESFSGKAYGIAQITEIAVRELERIVSRDQRIIDRADPEDPAYKRAKARLDAIYSLLLGEGYSEDRKIDFSAVKESSYNSWEYNIKVSAAILLTTFDYIQERIGPYKDGNYPIWRMVVAAYNWSKYGLVKAHKRDKYLWILQTSELSVHTTRFQERYEQLLGKKPEGEYWDMPDIVERLVEGVYSEMSEGRFGEARTIINKLAKDWTLKKFFKYAKRKKLDIQKIKEYLGIESDKELKFLLDKPLREILRGKADIPGSLPLGPALLLIGGSSKGSGGGEAVGEIIDGQKPRILQHPSAGILRLELRDEITGDVRTLDLNAVPVAKTSDITNKINMLRSAAKGLKDSFYKGMALGILKYLEKNLGSFYLIEDDPNVISVAGQGIICINQRIMESFGCETALLRIGGRAYLNAFPEKAQRHGVEGTLDYLQKEIAGEIDSSYYREFTSRDPITRRLMREGYFCYPWDRYFWLEYGLEAKCQQGWKLHIAATIGDAVEIMNLVLPVIRRYKLPHKIVNGLDRLDRLNSGRDTQIGKFICVYIDIEDREEAAYIAGKLGREIDRILAGKGFGVPEGILWDKGGTNGDKLIKLKEGEAPSGLVGYRYGSFKEDFVELENGLRIRDDRKVYKPRNMKETIAAEVDIADTIKDIVNRLGLSQEELDILISYLEFINIPSERFTDGMVFKFRHSLETVSIKGEKLFDRLIEEMPPHLLMGEDKSAFYEKLRGVLKEVLESMSIDATTHKAPGSVGLDEETKDDSEKEFVMKQIAENRRSDGVISEEVDKELSARVPGDKPDLRKIKVVVVEGVDRYGFARGPDKDKAKDLIYAYGEKTNGILHIYVTQRYWDSVLSRDPLQLAETIDHEWQENILGKSHRDAAARARFFVKEGEIISEYHRFIIEQLIGDWGGVIHLLGILMERRSVPEEPAVGVYEENFRDYIKERLFKIIDDTATKIQGSKWRKGSLLDVTEAERLVVIGDLHGRYDNLMEILARDGIWEDLAQGKAHIVILGDAIHPGSGYLESEAAQDDSFRTLLLLIRLISIFPENVHYIMGDHELSHLSEEFSIAKHDVSGKIVFQNRVFENYIREVYSAGFLEKIRDLFGALPYIGRINKDIVVTHAGSSRGLKSEQLEGLGIYDEVTGDITFKRDIEEDELDEFLAVAGGRLLFAGHTIPDEVYSEKYGFSVLKKTAIGHKYGKLIIINSQFSVYGYADIDMGKSRPKIGPGHLVDSKGNSALKTKGVDVFENVVDEVWAVLKKWDIGLNREVVWEVVAGVRKRDGETGLKELIELAKGAGIEPYGLLKLAKEIAIPLARLVSDKESARGGEFLADILSVLLAELDETGKKIAEGEDLREVFFNTVKTILVDYGITGAELAGELELIELGFSLLEHEPLLDLTKIDEGYFDYLEMVCELAGVTRDTLDRVFADAYKGRQIRDKTGRESKTIGKSDSPLSKAAKRLELYKEVNEKGIKEAGAVELELDTVLDFRDATAKTPQALVRYLSANAVADKCGDRLIEGLCIDKNKEARISIPEELFIEKIEGNEITYSPGLAAILRKIPDLTVEIRAADKEGLSMVLGAFIAENPGLRGRVLIRDEFKDADDLLRNKESGTTYVLSEKQKDYEGDIAGEIRSNNLKAFCTSRMALYAVLSYGILYSSVEKIFENGVYTKEAEEAIRKLELFGVSKELIDKILDKDNPIILIIITTEQLLRQYQLYRATIAISA